MTKNGKKDTICGSFTMERMTRGHLPQVMEIEEKSFSSPWKTSYFETELTYPDSTCLVATDGEKVIAYIILRNFVDEVHIMNIAVRPELRGKGIAASMMEYVFKNVSKEKFMLLEVRRSNTAAQKLYKKMGFIDLYTRKSYYADGEDAIVMVKGYLPE